MITKGKWIVVPNQYNEMIDEGKHTGSICVDDDVEGYYICTMEEVETLEGVSQWKDNANLIAAAPEMLDALKLINEYLEASYPINMALKGGAVLKVESAIKKAEGE